MAEISRRVIWVIDNDQNDLRLYSSWLQIGINELLNQPHQVEVNELLAHPYKESYLQILDDPDTAAIVLDQRLATKGAIDHSGIQLARYLRAISDIMPIYILTAVPNDDEYTDGAWSVEDIIKKEDLIDKNKRKMVVARMLRHINVYFNALGDREKRFRELLKKSIGETINEDEQKELEDLEFSRVATTFAFEQTQQGKPDHLDEVLEQIAKLKEMISDLQDSPKE